MSAKRPEMPYAYQPDSYGKFHCDAFGCDETHPLEHDMLGEPGFGTGRWLGWLYLDLNRNDLFPRELRFCSVECASWWLDTARNVRSIDRLSQKKYQPTALDLALRNPDDEVMRERALRERRERQESKPRPPRPRRAPAAASGLLGKERTE
jgi:hypothetical protein